MAQKIQNIGKQYTSQKNANKQRHERRKQVVKKRNYVFEGRVLAIIIAVSYTPMILPSPQKM
ncbi:hypothetical protein [Staphylococcus pseudintermedius]|uniref:hypothetical protein n=1 Tax=Staphylococcus pseudintermedius TaxID=283734 RepID=UPI001F5C0064|nr:hypothetical protein [Staphylococcus pseudintermedius]